MDSNHNSISGYSLYTALLWYGLGDDKMTDDNTKPEFFALWSIRDLQVECARLNQVLKECIEIAEKVSKTDE